MQIPRGQGTYSKRQKDKATSLWFGKSNIEIKTCMAGLAIFKTQNKAHEHFRGILYYFCFFWYYIFAI